jgi:hypothetical protein
MLSTSDTAAIRQDARESALGGQLYDSKGTRRATANKLWDAFGGKTPLILGSQMLQRPLFLGLECVVVAGTGAEKTVPLALPLFALRLLPGYIPIVTICASI